MLDANRFQHVHIFIALFHITKDQVRKIVYNIINPLVCTWIRTIVHEIDLHRYNLDPPWLGGADIVAYMAKCRGFNLSCFNNIIIGR